MRTLTRIFCGITVAVLLAHQAQAQTLIDHTTFSTALTGIGTPQAPYETTVSLAATTCTGCTFGNQTLIFVGREALQVTGAYTSGSTNIPVRRCVFGTLCGPHSTSAVVWVGPPVRFKGVGAVAAQLGDMPNDAGTCTRSNYPFMPWINISNGNVWTCSLTGSVKVTNPINITYNSTDLFHDDAASLPPDDPMSRGLRFLGQGSKDMRDTVSNIAMVFALILGVSLWVAFRREPWTEPLRE